MSDSHYMIRNYQPSDFNSYARLRAEAIRLAINGGYISPRLIREEMGYPGYSPEQDLFVAEISQAIVGYMDVIPEVDIGRVILDCFIHPGHRRKGLATRLLDCARQRGKELGTKVAHVNIRESNILAQRVLIKLGFQSIRRFHELRLNLTEVTFQEPATSFPIRHFETGQEDRLTQIQNRSFTGSWGYQPNTEKQIRYKTGMSNCEREGILLACEGDKPIGYCWTRIEGGEKTTADESKGRIFMMGVDPDYRGKDIGRAVLLAGLSYLKSKGLHLAELTVDSENDVAYALYRSVGFETCDTSLWYEKTLD